MSTLALPRYEEIWFDGVDDMLAEARARLQRLSPRAAYQAALWSTAVLVDVRPESQRAAQGDIDPRLGPLAVERIDLEWLLDPRSAARLPIAFYDLPVVVVDAEGTTSSLAAESLQRLGLHAATDVVGGFAAWRRQGMPVSPPAARA
ncbi:sulfurtransferase [Nocardioides zeae]|uniref:Sulfurtransferase n=1 Tax=Nocardioides imazamoxiresistens TaxID=3231893 RepID=A0ABU3PYR0_9ACTN|nr:rhodanese-like domain-containing protein [Nocardioides zeae]MDT9594370.1 sulfurtransferase [Nocardioides zeae]